MRGLTVLAVIFILTVLVYLPAFGNFFAQDDFLFIEHFSQNSLLVDIKNVVGLPTITHWRPLHNLYFLISGNIFGRNYFGYHLITIVIHSLTSFMIYKIYKLLFKDKRGAIFASIVYSLHPAHFVAMFWISGSAVNIGFFFLAAALYSYLLNRKYQAISLYLLSLLASESMLVGLILFYCINTLKQKRVVSFDRFFLTAVSSSVIFLLARIIWLTPKTTFDVYQLELSFQNFLALKFYLLRTLGFVEGYGKSIISLILIVWLGILSFFGLQRLRRKRGDASYFAFGLVVLIVGLFPFVLIPNHVSAHYMAVSVWGFSILCGLTANGFKNSFLIGLGVLFLVISFYSVRLNEKNSWVVDRSELARGLIKRIETDNQPANSVVIFDDDLASSKEKYIALGQGEAIDFWFADKNYKTCFTFKKNCSDN